MSTITIEIMLIAGCLICIIFIAIILVKMNSRSYERKEMDEFRKNLVKTVYPCFSESRLVESGDNPFGI